MGISPHITIIILNYNGKQFLTSCLEAVFNQTYSTSLYQVVVADNKSTDGSCELVLTQFPKVKLIKHGSNFGFARGNNEAVLNTQGEYIVFLNVDTVVDKDWLQSLVTTLESSPYIGIVSAKAYLFDNPEVVQNAGNCVYKVGYAMDRGARIANRTLEYETDSPYYKKEVLIHAGCGVSMAVRLDVFTKLGGFDEDFFMYYEDIDLSLRVRRLGYQCIFDPNAKLLHKHAGTSDTTSNFFMFHSERSRLLWVVKHFPTSVIVSVILEYGAMVIKSLLVCCLRPGKMSLGQAYTRMRVLLSLLTGIPVMLIKRLRTENNYSIPFENIYDSFY